MIKEAVSHVIQPANQSTGRESQNWREIPLYFPHTECSQGDTWAGVGTSDQGFPSLTNTEGGGDRCKEQRKPNNPAKFLTMTESLVTFNGIIEIALRKFDLGSTKPKPLYKIQLQPSD